MKNTILLLLSSIFYFVISCKGPKPVIVESVLSDSNNPTQADVDRVKSRFPTITIDQLLKGKSIYENQCNRCHELVKPERESVGKWYHEVPEMSGMRNEQEPNSISTDDENLILQYVVTFAKK